VTDRLVRCFVLAVLARLAHGQLTVLEDGRRHCFGSGAPRAVLRVRAPRFWRSMLRGSRGLSTAYADGLWESPDVTALVRLAAINMPAVDRLRRLLLPPRAVWLAVTGRLRRNTRRRSRRDISAHYDLGNKLFELMLDPTMMYSSAVFEHPDMTLAQASEAKLERICRRLGLSPADHVLEIGTGWGGFALYAAGRFGCRVTTTTISQEQRAFAQERVRAAGLEDRVTVLLEDYRDLRGSYDKLVSIEMIEAVGWRDFDTFFACCAQLLTPEGAMLLQAITIDDRAYEVEKASRSFANTVIFPGGCLPSMEVISRSVARHTDLRPIFVEDLSPHYVETLRHWRRRFVANREGLKALGYDERFRRLWTLYLAYSEGGFAERRIQSVQVTLAKPSFRAERVSALSPLTAHDPVALASV